ncbi:MAG TPA: polysaccharide deacetylase family protein [Acidimicrobiales bacterium]|nr:polysaccharide deacetylase family protein [Acidimicrobiales bacterium]
MSPLTLLERPPAPPAAPAPRPPRAGATLAPRVPRTVGETRAQVRQLVVGLVALPLTVLPFVAYLNMTPEGRLVRDRALVALAPPRLPTLSPEQRAAAVAAAPRYDNAVMALAYHGIGSAGDGEGGFVISAKQFGEHLATLKAAGMRTVTAAQVAAAFTGGEPLPPNAVMMSFDDGRSDAMMFADPLLDQADMSATMFLIADAASKPGIYYASWERVESYAGSGRWDIQSHTAASHREHKAVGGDSLPLLTSLRPGESLAGYGARIDDDLEKASAAIEAHVGRRPVAFAYPFGAYGADRSNHPAIAGILRDKVARQYAVAFHQDEQETVPLLTADHDLLRLRRVEVQNWSGLELLERIERARQLAAEPDGAPATTTPEAPAPPVAAGQAPTGSGDTSSPPSTSPGPAAARSVAPLTTVAPSPAGIPAILPAAPSVNVTVPTATTPTVTTPPAPVVTTPPTQPPPPTASPPTTTPPATVCKPAGKSGKCAGG